MYACKSDLVKLKWGAIKMHWRLSMQTMCRIKTLQRKP